MSARRVVHDTGTEGGIGEMGTPENPVWLFDCQLMDEIPVAGGDFVNPVAGGIYWRSPHGFNGPSDTTVGIDGSIADSDCSKELASQKRPRPESSNGPGSKACREKMRRDKLNDRFLELGAILEPGQPPKMDKTAILSDAVRVVNQLRGGVQKLRESNESLHEMIKELKAEKNELRDEKQRLKVEREKLEQQLKAMSVQPSFVPHPPPMLPMPFAVQGQAAGNKLMMPVIGFPGYPMWQYMPPADVDTSQDAESCPPVA